MTKDKFKKELTKFNAWKDRHRFDENLQDYIDDVEYYIEQCVKKGQLLPIDNVSVSLPTDEKKETPLRPKS